MDDLIRLLQNGRHSLVVLGEEIRTFDGCGVFDLSLLSSLLPKRLGLLLIGAE